MRHRLTNHVSFVELKAFLSGLPNQTIGRASSVCETGESYVAFSEWALARPSDVDVIEAVVAERMSKNIQDYLGIRGGRIYWRVPFEHEVVEHSVVVRYDENGPDVDPVLNRKCVTDKNWRRVSCYCRLYKATCMVDDAPRLVHAQHSGQLYGGNDGGMFASFPGGMIEEGDPVVRMKGFGEATSQAIGRPRHAWQWATGFLDPAGSQFRLDNTGGHQ